MDISKCTNEKCKKKIECLRYRLIPEKYQDCSIFDEICNEENNYDFFIKIKAEELKQLNYTKM